MRSLKWISMLTILAMLFAILPATVAEDEIAIETEEAADKAFEIEVAGELEGETLEGLAAIDDPSLSLADTDLTLDGLADADLALDEPEESLLIPETEEQAETPVAANASGDFEIDEEGTLVRYGGFEKHVVIPDGVKGIGGSAFQSYTALESVSIPISVTFIGDYAFIDCTSLKSITIPEGVVTIENYAFSGCTSLSSVMLPNSLKTIGYSAFEYCTSLKSITIPSGITRLYNDVFRGCSSLTDIQFPFALTEMPNGLFRDCDSLENMDFLSGFCKISDYLFSYCDGLKNITIPSSVTNIGIGAFSNCKNLESITIHSDVTFIDRTAFDGSDKVIIRGTPGTYAENYANGVGIPFNAPVVYINEKNSHVYEIDDEALILHISQYRTLDVDQKPADLARTLTWSSSDENVVTVDQDGKIKGISQGTAIITVNTADGKGKAAQIKVYVPEPSDIKISDWDTAIFGQTSTIYADIETPYQYVSKVDMPITWSSSDSSVISIESASDLHAILKCKKLGKTIITATTPDGGKASMELAVIRPEVKNIKIDQSGPIELHPGEQYKLTATLSPEGAEAGITWHSENTGIATVSKDGVVTAVAEGEAWVEVRADNEWSDERKINVIPLHPHPDGVKIDQSSPVTLHPGEQYKLTATLSPEGAEAAITWYSDDADIATVSKDGVVTAVAEGEAWVEVRTDNEWSDEIKINVIPLHPHPDSIKIKQPGPIKLYPGQKTTLTTTLTPADAEAKLEWYSWDTYVATVSQSGVITAVNPGYAEIQVETDNGEEDYIEVYVLTPPQKVTLSKTSATLAVGGTLTLKAAVAPGDAETGLAWSSSNTAVAKVSQAGKVTALKVGKAKITVRTQNGKTAKATVTVKPVPRSVKLNKTKVTLGVKESLTLKATLTPTNAYTTLTWTSSRPAFATVSGKGVVTPKKPGTTVITVRTKNGKTAKATVTVKAAPKKITLNKSGTVTLKKGKTLTLKATLPANTASALTWTSSKPSVASVDKNGKVTAKAKGTAVITVKTFNKKTAKVTVKVQ